MIWQIYHFTANFCAKLKNFTCPSASTRDCLHPDAHPDHQHTVSDVRYGITLGRIRGKIISWGGVVLDLSRFLVDPIPVLISAHSSHKDCTFFDGYFSTVHGLLDWCEVDLGFTEL